MLRPTALIVCGRRRVQAVVDAYVRPLRARRDTHTTATSGSHAGLPQHTDLLEQYRSLVALGKLQYDEDQIRVIMQLRRLRNDLSEYAPPALPSHFHRALSSEMTNEEAWWRHSDREADFDPGMHTTALTRVRSHAEELAELSTPKGLLVTGPPGSGKTLLIDLWFASVPTPYKTRKHYSQLVLEMYRAVWEETQRRVANLHAARPSPHEPPVRWGRAMRDRWRALVGAGGLPARWVRGPGAFAYPSAEPSIAFAVARRLVLHHWLLVFDEVQLLDVSSATLLADVLSWFWRMGGIVIGSSNRVPEDLYKNGVQRERLEPFVEALKARCPLVEMRGERDWREVRAGRGEGRTWFTYGQNEEFERVLKNLVGQHAEPQRTTLQVFSRALHIPWSSNGVCKISFAELCEEDLGPADYLSTASTFHTIAITDIPILKVSSQNQARRFISLIDALYEARCRIICLAETEPDGLFFPDGVTTPSVQHAQDMDAMMAESVSETQGLYRPNVASYDAPQMAEAPATPSAPLALETLSIFSGKDEQFAYKRALSRLLEMTSRSYGGEERWAPLSPSTRKWERPSKPPAVEGTPESTEAVGRRPGSASRTTYRSTMRMQDRPEAPRFGERHWGVRRDDR